MEIMLFQSFEERFKAVLQLLRFQIVALARDRLVQIDAAGAEIS